MKIGVITKEQIIKGRKRAARENELQNSVGWVATTKVHSTLKDYKRKPKFKPNYFNED